MNSDSIGIYIGSKISLISVSEIRYVGFLHDMNTVDSTLSLWNVQSFGTEGRKGNDPNKEIDPFNHIFGYILFHQKNIKDIQVLEAPPSQFGLIYLFFKHVDYNAPYYYLQQAYNIGLYGDNNHFLPYIDNYHPLLCNNNYPTLVNNNMLQHQYYSLPTSTNSLGDHQLQLQHTHSNIEDISTQDEKKNEVIRNEEESETKVKETIIDSLVKQVSDLEFKEVIPQNESKKTPCQGNINGIKTEIKETGKRESLGKVDAIRFSHYKKSTLVVPNVDFDFASANDKFVRENLLQTNDQGFIARKSSKAELFYDKVWVMVDAYNKKRSFFDDISCDTKEKYKKGQKRYYYHRKSLYCNMIYLNGCYFRSYVDVA
ncbi:Scd6-like Sm domain-containing protein [Cokeromyces recurvatus]|uniref:Scd6-like Sm domain-containing protein n=1 Tax=Cokeromyces recurvatus TaxID=90255 RepID=UPI00221FAA44|nr:Scd6-like Sm domain-containing protein [Cokeromyces recurvatus]KAI7903006.1 Scd6-like Sm domain-containing protein [Cokeromyces recurvatus]